MPTNYVDTYTNTGTFDEALRRFSGEDTEVAFPLGGIGTGNVSLDARGGLRDWELFNRPEKGNDLPYSFFTLWCERPDGGQVTRVLESQHQAPHNHSHGYSPPTTAGLPRLDATEFYGEYPVATVKFADDDVPVEVSLSAYTPFIPLNPDDSGLPVGIFEYTIENPTADPLEVSVAGSLANPVGYREELEPGRHHNEFRLGERLSGIHYTSEKYPAGTLGYGEAVLGALETDDVTHKAAWERTDWWDAFRGFGDDFTADGRLTQNAYDNPSKDGETDVGSLAVTKRLDPGEEQTITFLLAWYFPNRPYSWDQRIPEGAAETTVDCCSSEDCCSSDGDSGLSGEEEIDLVRNYYATRFDGAWDVATYVATEFDRLRDSTFAFSDAFFGSTLPGYVLEAVSSQIAVARSTTCMWFEDGVFAGYEGEHCCSGNCTHVWNYAWTLAALFPSLEREMRRMDLEEGTDDDGYMSYRTPLPPADEQLCTYHDEHPAIDGQMGTIMRLYREWTRSGDDAVLERLWPHAKRALEFAFDYEEWDSDLNGVLKGEQHNTYDIEFYGPNALSQSWYLGALCASIEMAKAVGDVEAAETYENIFEEGRERTDDILWNGEYYAQVIEDVDAHRYQYGRGCLSDQLLGQWYAERLDLDDVLPAEHIQAALDSIYRYNFRDDISDHFNYQRTYALNDERGLLLCSWPHGDEPEYPFVYSDEMWTGIEYQVASQLISKGAVEKGLDIVQAIRERHDGTRRNPWNEFECGNHYARAMASWTVYAAYCGLKVDLTDRVDGVNEHGFAVDPAVEINDFRCFWITGDEWGTYEQHVTDDGTEERINVRYERAK